jgi:hypothetical protein
MPVILTDHAKKRMVERGITFKQIEDTIEMPDYTVQNGNKIEAHKTHEGRRIKVVYSGKDKYKKVISVM